MFDFMKRKKKKETFDELDTNEKHENEADVKARLAEARAQIEARKASRGFVSYSPLGTHPAMREVYSNINSSVSNFHTEKYKLQLLITIDLLCEEFNVDRSEYLKKAEESAEYKKAILGMENSLNESKRSMLSYANGLSLR